MDSDNLIDAAVTLGVTLPLTMGLLNMTQQNVNSMLKATKKKRMPYADWGYPQMKKTRPKKRN